MYVHGILFLFLFIDIARELIVNVVINQKRFLYITEVYNALIFIEVKEGKNNALVRKFEEFVEDKEDFAYERYVLTTEYIKGGAAAIEESWQTLRLSRTNKFWGRESIWRLSPICAAQKDGPVWIG